MEDPQSRKGKPLDRYYPVFLTHGDGKEETRLTEYPKDLSVLDPKGRLNLNWTLYVISRPGTTKTGSCKGRSFEKKDEEGELLEKIYDRIDACVREQRKSLKETCERYERDGRKFCKKLRFPVTLRDVKGKKRTIRKYPMTLKECLADRASMTVIVNGKVYELPHVRGPSDTEALYAVHGAIDKEIERSWDVRRVEGREERERETFDDIKFQRFREMFAEEKDDKRSQTCPMIGMVFVSCALLSITTLFRR